MDFYKIVCGVMIGVLLAVKLKSVGSPIWIYMSMGISLFVLYYAVDRLSFVMEFLNGILDDIGLESGYFDILLKIVGISYLCEFVSNICKESGFPSVAGQVEIGGKLTMMVMSMPVLLAIINTITSVL